MKVVYLVSVRASDVCYACVHILAKHFFKKQFFEALLQKHNNKKADESRKKPKEGFESQTLFKPSMHIIKT